MNAKLLREYIYYETTIEKYIIPFIRLHDEDFKAHLMLFILALCSIMPFAISEAIGREGTAIVIKSQDITAYNAVAEGFERYGQNDTITIKAVYNLKGDIEEGKRVIHHIAEIKPKPDVILTIGTLATTFAKNILIIRLSYFAL